MAVKLASPSSNDFCRVQELLSQAAWNLCPVSGIPSGNACYYSSDQTFDALTGSVSIQITDCPDGERRVFPPCQQGHRACNHHHLQCKLQTRLITTAGDWELDIKRDLFNKVSGGVRRLDHLTLAAELEKIQ